MTLELVTPHAGNQLKCIKFTFSVNHTHWRSLGENTTGKTFNSGQTHLWSDLFLFPSFISGISEQQKEQEPARHEPGGLYVKQISMLPILLSKLFGLLPLSVFQIWGFKHEWHTVDLFNCHWAPTQSLTFVEFRGHYSHFLGWLQTKESS
jgi:hypothetical protein